MARDFAHVLTGPHKLSPRKCNFLSLTNQNTQDCSEITRHLLGIIENNIRKKTGIVLRTFQKENSSQTENVLFFSIIF